MQEVPDEPAVTRRAARRAHDSRSRQTHAGEFASNQFYLYSLAQSGLIVDLLGCFSPNAGGLRYIPFSLPVRQLSGTILGSGGVVDVVTSSQPSQAALVRATGVNGPSPTFLTLYSPSRPNPGTSNVNLMPSAVAGNHAVVPTNSANQVRVYRGAHPDTTNVILDMFGRFVS